MKQVRALVLLAAALLVALAGVARTLAHACPESGFVISACCCHEGAEEHEGPVLKQDHTGCCEVVVSLVDDATPSTHTTVSELAAASLIATAPHGFSAPDVRPARRLLAPAPPRAPPRPAGAELCFRTCSLLL